MSANENNSFYRLSLIAQERIEHNRVEKEQKEKRAKQEQKEGTENTSQDDDLELGKPAFTGVNVRHNGGGNHMYLPKAERTRNQIGVFSGFGGQFPAPWPYYPALGCPRVDESPI